MATQKSTIFMLDLETVGKNPENDVILAAGMVVGNSLGTVHYEHEFIFPLIEQVSTMERNFCEEGEDWWREDEKREVVFEEYLTQVIAQKTSMAEVLYEFETEIRSQTMVNSRPLIFCNGPQFDVVGLKSLFGYFERPLPWDYKCVGDFKTIRLLAHAKGITGDQDEVEHNALADSQVQYYQLINYLKGLGIDL